MDLLRSHAAGAVVGPDDLVALQALAEPNRARIIELLGHGEHCVCNVGTALAMSPALVSHHLRVLRTSGLLRERSKGRWTFYSLDLDRIARLRGTLAAFLTPPDAAAGPCCSDCAPAKAAGEAEGRHLRPLPVMAGGVG